MATVNNGEFTVTRHSLRFTPNNDLIVELVYANAVSGRVISRRLVAFPSAGGAVTDGEGTVFSASVPAAISNAVASLLSAADSTIANGASSGKLNL